MILAALQSCTKLTVGHKRVDVVVTNKVLSHANNCTCQTLFSVVVCCSFRNISNKLSNLCFGFEISLEATIEDFSLTRLETIDDGRN